jgi:twitching motility protein PilT
VAHIDQIIAHMAQGKMDRAVLSSDEPMHFYSGSQEVAGPLLSAVQVRNVAQDCTPPVLKPQLTQDGSFHFPYQSPNGQFDITIQRHDTKFKVVVSAADALADSVPSANGEGAISSGIATAAPTSDHSVQAETAAPAAKKSIGHMDELFHLMASRDASDLHLSSGELPMVRIQGTMHKLNEYSICEPGELQRLLFQITPLRNREEWEDEHDSDFSYEVAGIGRFRCNLFADRRGIGGVFRLIPSKLRTVADLGLPKAMVDFCFLSKGLIVVTGPTGSGKSTTLAALIDHINKHRSDHIVTVEDPVEFVHDNIKCLVNQREVHVNTESFAAALRASLREDPDIIMVGEMRDLETTRRAIEAAETGHLVFGTLHTSSAASTVDRIIDQFPAEEQSQIRVMLSETLKGVVAQALLRTKDSQRVAAFELLLVPTSVSNLIREGKTFQLPSQIQIGKSLGMMTMNESILNYVKAGRVDPAEGYLKAIDKNGLLSAYESNGIPLPTSAA